MFAGEQDGEAAPCHFQLAGIYRTLCAIWRHLGGIGETVRLNQQIFLNPGFQMAIQIHLHQHARTLGVAASTFWPWKAVEWKASFVNEGQREGGQGY